VVDHDGRVHVRFGEQRFRRVDRRLLLRQLIIEALCAEKLFELGKLGVGQAPLARFHHEGQAGHDITAAAQDFGELLQNLRYRCRLADDHLDRLAGPFQHKPFSFHPAPFLSQDCSTSCSV
jgi:hypothetical protein